MKRIAFIVSCALACAHEAPAPVQVKRFSAPPAKTEAAPFLIVASRTDAPLCPSQLQVLFAVYADRALFRTGGPCQRDGEEPLKELPLTPEEARRLLQDIAYNPLINGGKSPLLLCDGCVGRQLDLVAIRGQSGFGMFAVLGAGSGGAPVSAAGAEHDAALAAEALLASVDRLRGWSGRQESKPWAGVTLSLKRAGRTPDQACAWPDEWPHAWPDVPLDTAEVPADALAEWMRRCRGLVKVGSGVFSVSQAPWIPGKAALGKPFATVR